MSPIRNNVKNINNIEMRIAALEELDLQNLLPKIKHEIESRVSLEESKKIYTELAQNRDLIDCLTKACVQKTELDDLLLKSGLFKATTERLDICISNNSSKENI